MFTLLFTFALIALLVALIAIMCRPDNDLTEKSKSLKMSLPCIWQTKKAAEKYPGKWMGTSVLYEADKGSGKYKAAFFNDGKDYVMQPNEYLTIEQAFKMWQENSTNVDLQLMDFQKYKKYYGMRNLS